MYQLASPVTEWGRACYSVNHQSPSMHQGASPVTE